MEGTDLWLVIRAKELEKWKTERDGGCIVIIKEITLTCPSSLL